MLGIMFGLVFLTYLQQAPKVLYMLKHNWSLDSTSQVQYSEFHPMPRLNSKRQFAAKDFLVSSIVTKLSET